MQKLAKYKDKEVLLWKGDLSSSDNVIVTGARNYKRFKLVVSQIGNIYVDKYSATDSRFSGMKNSKLNASDNYFVCFANVIVNFDNDNFYNDGCYFCTIENINKKPDTFQIITEIWGVE